MSPGHFRDAGQVEIQVTRPEISQHARNPQRRALTVPWRKHRLQRFRQKAIDFLDQVVLQRGRFTIDAVYGRAPSAGGKTQDSGFKRPGDNSRAPTAARLAGRSANRDAGKAPKGRWDPMPIASAYCRVRNPRRLAQIIADFGHCLGLLGMMRNRAVGGFEGCAKVRADRR